MLRLDISGVHLNVDDKLNKYVQRKIGRLDRYLPKGALESAHGKVVLSEGNGKSNNRFTCEAILSLPKHQVTAKESTINIYAAVDIVEAKLKSQLQRYKTKAKPDKRARRFIRHLKRFGRR